MPRNKTLISIIIIKAYFTKTQSVYARFQQGTFLMHLYTSSSNILTNGHKLCIRGYPSTNTAGKILTNYWWLVEFIKTIACQKFALCGITSPLLLAMYSIPPNGL